MISDDPSKRPSIEQVKLFLTRHRSSLNGKKVTAKDLGITADLQTLDGSIDSDVKRRVAKFEQCPFSAVNIMDKLNSFTSYAELSKAGYHSNHLKLSMN